MENPCLTFVTPTLLAGDRSLANVVAHEIAHSWTGNLVTNASWEHFWLNEGAQPRPAAPGGRALCQEEASARAPRTCNPRCAARCRRAGFTVFLERKILGRLKGPSTYAFHASGEVLS